MASAIFIYFFFIEEPLPLPLHLQLPPPQFQHHQIFNAVTNHEDVKAQQQKRRMPPALLTEEQKQLVSEEMNQANLGNFIKVLRSDFIEKLLFITFLCGKFSKIPLFGPKNF